MTKLAHTPPERIKEVKEFLKKTKNARERERARAILKLIEGRPRRLVADFFDISLKSLDTWQRNFKKLGIVGLQTKPQKGNHHLLTRKQKQKIKEIITAHTPEEVRQEGKFWNVPRLAKLIKKEFGVTYRSTVAYQKLFAFCGFTFHKPVKVNKKQNSHLRKRFEDVLKKRSDGTVEKMVWYW